MHGSYAHVNASPASAMSWDLAKVVLALSRTGSMSAAAAQLELSQPSVSRIVAELEERLGQPLFVRHARGVRATALGQLLVEAAAGVEASMQGFERLARGASAARGTVRLAATEVIGTEVILPRLRELRASCPKLAVELVLDNRVSDLARGEADLAVRMARPRQPELVTRQVASLELGFYASVDYVHRHGHPRTLDELTEHDLIGFDPRGPLAGAVAQLSPRLAAAACSLRSDSLIVHLLAARHGAGIAVLQTQLAQRFPELVRVARQAELPALEVWLAMHRDLRRSGPVRVTYEWLAGVLAQYAGGS